MCGFFHLVCFVYSHAFTAHTLYLLLYTYNPTLVDYCASISDQTTHYSRRYEFINKARKLVRTNQYLNRRGFTTPFRAVHLISCLSFQNTNYSSQDGSQRRFFSFISSPAHSLSFVTNRVFIRAILSIFTIFRHDELSPRITRYVVSLSYFISCSVTYCIYTTHLETASCKLLDFIIAYSLYGVIIWYSPLTTLTL